MKTKSIFFAVILTFQLSACTLPAQTSGGLEKTENNTAKALSSDKATLPSTQTSSPTATAVPTQTRVPPTPTPVAFGPGLQDFPSGINPLTGSSVQNPELLKLPAVLISITNFPPSARPQSGLSYASWVYELYISEGMTRFLSVFYGDYPQLAKPSQPLPVSTVLAANVTATPAAIKVDAEIPSAMIGPIRSGRLPYAYIRDFYRSSCLVYAGATVQIRNKLKGCSLIFGSDEGNINSAMLDVTKLQTLAETNLVPNSPFNYTGNSFTEIAPPNGIPASQLDIFYSYLNQGQWLFDEATGKYLKFEDFADGSGKFRPMTDRLNGQQLAYSNVIVLYAEHTVLDPYIIDVSLGSGERGKAVIFRDGQKYNAVWTTMNGEYEKETGMRRPIRFEDEAGNPFPLKPGQSWVHLFTPYAYVEDKTAGVWLLRFVAPAGTK